MQSTNHSAHIIFLTGEIYHIDFYFNEQLFSLAVIKIFSYCERRQATWSMLTMEGKRSVVGGLLQNKHKMFLTQVFVCLINFLSHGCLVHTILFTPSGNFLTHSLRSFVRKFPSVVNKSRMYSPPM